MDADKRKRCDSIYKGRGRIVRCHLKKGHSGNHQWFSWFWFLPRSCLYEWSDSLPETVANNINTIEVG